MAANSGDMCTALVASYWLPLAFKILIISRGISPPPLVLLFSFGVLLSGQMRATSRWSDQLCLETCHTWCFCFRSASSPSSPLVVQHSFRLVAYETSERKCSNTLECRMQNTCIRHVVVASLLFLFSLLLLFLVGPTDRPQWRDSVNFSIPHPSCWAYATKRAALCPKRSFGSLPFIYFFSTDLHRLRIGCHRGTVGAAHIFGTAQLKKRLRAEKASNP